jgi:uridylate kinase
MKNGSPKYKRLILKVTGEVFAGPYKFGIDGQTVKAFAQEIKTVGEEIFVAHGTGTQVGDATEMQRRGQGRSCGTQA